MKKAYICSRYAHLTTEERIKYINYARNMCRTVILKGHDIEVVHLVYTQFLDDKSVHEREIGTRLGLSRLTECDVLIAGVKYGISTGMSAEIRLAESLGIKVIEIIEVDEIEDIL